MNDKKREDKKLKKKDKNKWPLPNCTSAPAAEQHRARDEDEPCDDSRDGNLDEETK